MLYVENFMIARDSGGGFNLQPSYEVDYEISDDIIEYLEKSLQDGVVENIWYHKISVYRNINNIPSPLFELAVQYLPIFLQEYPQYKDEWCLQIKRDGGANFAVTREIPNGETLAAMAEVELMIMDSSKGKIYHDVDSMMKDLL